MRELKYWSKDVLHFCYKITNSIVNYSIVSFPVGYSIKLVVIYRNKSLTDFASKNSYDLRQYGIQKYRQEIVGHIRVSENNNAKCSFKKTTLKQIRK